MPLDKAISMVAPAGYDQRLWDSIPAVRTQKHRGKHETYVYGQVQRRRHRMYRLRLADPRCDDWSRGR